MIKIPEYFINDRNVKSHTLENNTLLLQKSVFDSKGKVEYHLTDFLIGYVISGKKRIHNTFNQIELVQGEYFFIPKGVYYLIDVYDIANFECILLFFNTSFLKQIFFQEKKRKHNDILSPKKINKSNLLDNFFSSLLLYLDEKMVSLDILNVKVKELFLILINDEKDSSIANYLSKSGLSQKSVEYIMENNYLKPLSINDFANLCNKSESSFKRDFKKIYNDTPVSWIRRKRLDKAAYLLTVKDYTVTECAFEVGYSNISYFIKIFTKQFGVSPKQFKSQQEI
ncbi:AraC family transcriptional regulator [Yeosuana marina]|uniref:AraC family transcriptional regulator n=1 Tax=Yeosuana marina TaxID=1565536 RepID=UPI001421BBEB|nr:AraC family transcriptional regulator [Yeosuana marina]